MSTLMSSRCGFSRGLACVALLAASALLGACFFDESGLAPPGTGSDATVPPDGAPNDGAPPDAGPGCGNGRQEGDESCDGTDLGGATCHSLGEGGGELACTTACEYDLTACTDCGNGVLDATELCDGPNLGGATCATLGYFAGVLSCSPSCTYDTSECSQCGNDIQESPEQCDGTDFGGTTCQDLGFDDGALACDNLCHLDDTACSLCGDGVREDPEECDDADLGATCVDLGHTEGTPTCTLGCTLDDSTCADCGNDQVEAPEECDDGAANSDVVPDACRSNCRLPSCGDGVCDTAEHGGLCPADCTTVVFTESFEGTWPDLWSASDSDGGSGDDFWGVSGSRDHSGGHSLWCAEDGWNITGYDDNMNALAQHPLDLSPYPGQTITLTLWVWVHTDGSNDYYQTRLSTDGGTNWTTLEQIDGDHSSWTQKTYDLSAEAGNDQVRLGLRFVSNGIGSVNEGAYVDDIRVTALQ